MSKNFSLKELGLLEAILLTTAIGSVAFELLDVNPLGCTVMASLCIMILAVYLGSATEVVAHRVGSNLGALVNASFGNATELILGIVGINNGLFPVIKDSLAGGVYANLLLIGGCAALFGGIAAQKRNKSAGCERSSELRFNRAGSHAGVTILWITAILVFFPTLLHLTSPNIIPFEGLMSVGLSAVCIALYAGYLFFSQSSHADLFEELIHQELEEDDDDGGFGWSTTIWVGILAIIAVGVGFESEFLMHNLEAATESLGLPEQFVAFCIVAFLGGVAEHWSGVSAAINNKIALANGVFVGSSIQLFLFVLPVFVIYGFLTGNDVSLVFHPIVMLLVGISIFIWDKISNDGSLNYLEGFGSIVVCFVGWAALFFVDKFGFTLFGTTF